MNELNDKSIEDKIAEIITECYQNGIKRKQVPKGYYAKKILALFRIKVECSECKCIPDCEYVNCDVDPQMGDYCPMFNIKSKCNCKGAGTEIVPFKRGVKGVCL